MGCPLLSTLLRSRGAARNALSGKDAEAGLDFPFPFGFPRDDVWPFAVVAGEARMVELDTPDVDGTWTMLAGMWAKCQGPDVVYV